MLVPPARVAKERFGGVAALAAAAGVSHRTVKYWLSPPSRRRADCRRVGGGGELPSSAVIRRLLDAAAGAGIALSEHELIYGTETTAQ